MGTCISVNHSSRRKLEIGGSIRTQGRPEMAEKSGRRGRGARDQPSTNGAEVRDPAAEDCPAGNRSSIGGNSTVSAIGNNGTVMTACSAGGSTANSATPPDGRPPSVRRKFRTMAFGRRCKSKAKTKEGPTKKRGGGGGKGALWSFKFNYRLKRAEQSDIPEPGSGCDACVCTGYRRTEEHHLGAGVVFQVAPPMVAASSSAPRRHLRELPIDLSKFNPDDFPIDDWEERARAERARELEEGVDPPPGYSPRAWFPGSPARLGDPGPSELATAFQNRLSVGASYEPFYEYQHYEPEDPEDPALPGGQLLMTQQAHVAATAARPRRVAHTQVDYVHCLVPDLREITACGFYWGKMDRYEAERLLEARPEGTFLLRDSAQEEHLFSVSFRRYGRSLHARVEQWNHWFSFDSHDPGVFASPTVRGLVEHYKDPGCCMFFEPMLTVPLHRTFPFALQHLCRAAVCGRTTYDGVNRLPLPRALKTYLKEYHYKQRVRVRMLEAEL